MKLKLFCIYILSIGILKQPLFYFCFLLLKLMFQNIFCFRCCIDDSQSLNSRCYNIFAFATETHILKYVCTFYVCNVFHIGANIITRKSSFTIL